jgi:predicted dehydrogenase
VSGRLPLLLVGAGAMGRTWAAALDGSTDAELVGVVDLDVDAARRAAADLGRPDLPVGADLLEVAGRTGAAGVVDVTVPAAHHVVTQTALRAGLPVLGEKPVAATLPQALSLAATADVTGRLFMVSQSRRWLPEVDALRAAVGRLGALGTATVHFAKAPHFGGFREEMAHPLLVDMAVHALDCARFVLDAEPVTVWCTSGNPPWSWYAGDAEATVVVGTDRGARLVYTGSWCAPGAETSWNGAWRVSGEHGTALWDGDAAPVLALGDAEPEVVDVVDGPREVRGALAAFCDALRTGARPWGEVHANVLSLATVEAAVASAATGQRVDVDELLARAHATAVADERHDDVRAALAGWSSVRAALAG